MPGMFTTGTTPPMIIGHCTRPFCFRSAGFSGLSEAPKVDGAGLDLLDAAARADRLVVQPHAGLRL